MRFLQTFTAVSLALAAFPATCLAQAPQAAAQTKSDISVDAKLVVVPATVRDKKDALVGTLKKEDFVLQVDGKPQTIRYFDHDSDTPLTLGLLVDTSQSQRSVIDAERTASASFLDKMLTPNRDKAFVVQFARQVELLQDITDSRPKLQEALKQLDTSSPSFQPSTSGDDDRDRYTRGGTALYDAIFLSSDEVMSKQKGRRALILLTDGADRNSKESLVNAIESAQRADTIIYAIYYKGEASRDRSGSFPGGGHRGGGYPGGGGGYPGGGYPGGGGGYPGSGGGSRPQGGGGRVNDIDGKKVLERICGETGGRVYDVNKKQTVDVIYAQIAEELRAQYRLGFTPTADSASDGYHRIVLTLASEAKTKDKDKSWVQTREGYYTGAAK